MGNELKSVQTILYVDDQASHRALFLKAFQSKYNIVTAASGEEGVEILKKNKFALVIADHNMPGMSGIDFLEKVQEMNPNVEKAILSAYLDDGITEDLNRRVKVSGQMAKPWKLEGMRGFIEKALSRPVFVAPVPSIAEEGDVSEVPALPTRIEEAPSDLASDKPLLSSGQLIQAVDHMVPEAVDHRGARRIFLSFVEPKIKSVFPVIRKPCAPLMKQAQDDALKGDVDSLDRTLRRYLCQDALAQIISEIADPSKKVIH